MVEGEAYALEMTEPADCLRVMVVSTTAAPPGKVRVRVDRAYDDSTEMDVPCRRIRCSWNRYRAGQVVLVDSPAFDEIAWIPEPGMEVERSDVVGCWRVEEVNLREGWAVLSGELVSRPLTETVPIERLFPADPLPQPTPAELDSWLADRGLAALHYEPAPPDKPRERGRAKAPQRGDHRPKAIACRLQFGEAACRQYRGQVEPCCRRGQEQSRMCREVKNWSVARVLHKGDAGFIHGEFIRYIVRGRFEVILYENPKLMPDEIQVDRIEVLKPKKRLRKTVTPRKNKKRNDRHAKRSRNQRKKRKRDSQHR